LLPVEIHPIQDALVLRARGSELLILSDHVAALKKLKSAGDFSKYFLQEALVNRPARKLFEAWLRKDGSLWARIYKTVQTIESNNSAPPAAKEKLAKAAEPSKEASKEAPKAAKKPEAEVKSTTKEKADTKKSAKSAPKAEVKADKTVKKPEAKTSAKKVEKPTSKTVAKSTAKPATKTASKPTAKTAAKKTAKK